jgi:hypothetical protein
VKPPFFKISLDGGVVVVAVGCAGYEARRVLGKESFQSGRDRVSEFVFLDTIPHIENQNATRSKHSTCLRKRLGLFWEEHHSELAYDGIKRLVRERQSHGVSLTPLNRTSGPDYGSLVEHCLIQIRGDDGDPFR